MNYTDKQAIHIAFQISRTIVFEVSYYRLGSNAHKHFSTSAAQFNRPKTDYNICGQAQNDLLKEGRKAMAFYKKWDVHHLGLLTDKQYAELLTDIETLKRQYNYHQSETDIRFSEMRQLSMMKIKKQPA